MPTSSTVWWRSTSRSPLASTVRSISACLDHASSMWLKNGMPVSILEAPGAVQVQVEDDLGLLRVALDPALPRLRRLRAPLPGHRAPSRAAAMRTAAAAPCPSRPSTRDSSADVRTRLGQPGRRILDHAEPRHEVLGRERRGEARGAAGRQHVVRPRHVVPHHLGRVPRRGTPPPRAAPARAAPPGRATCSSRCSGASPLASSTASSRLAVSTSAPWLASAAPAISRRGSAGELPAELGRDRVAQRGRRRQQHRAGHRVVLGLGQQVGGHEGRIRACRRPPPAPRSAPPPCRCPTSPKTWALASAT